MAENAQALRMDAQTKTLALADKEMDNDKADRLAGRSEAKRGQWMVFLLCIFIVAVCLILGLHGNETTAACLGGITLVSLASVFVVQRVTKDKQPPNKGQADK